MNIERPGNGADRLAVSDLVPGQFALIWLYFFGRPKATPRALIPSLPSLVRLAPGSRGHPEALAKHIAKVATSA
jgi:hypothetical protein